MICRHAKYRQVDATHFECEACGVWKGIREDAHHYTKEYYHAEAFGLFRNGIPQRTSVFNTYLTQHWGSLGIDLIDPSGVRCLEIGGGIGLLAYSLHLGGADSTIIDTSEWATKWMQEAYGEREGFRILWANIENVDPKTVEGPYDFIFANHVWEHLEDPMRITQWCFDQLATYGFLCLVLPDQERELAMHHTHNWAFSMECLHKWLKDAGFGKVASQEFDSNTAEEAGAFFRIAGWKVQ